MGERQEGGELYPWAARVGLGVAGGGSLAWSRVGGWWRTAAAPLHYGEVNLAAGSIWGEEGRRRGLCVELETAALMAATVVAAAF